MLPPGPGSADLKTRHAAACCLRRGSLLLPSASLTRAMTASKSAPFPGLMALKMIPASDVKVRGTGGPAAFGSAAGGAAGGWVGGGVWAGGVPGGAAGGAAGGCACVGGVCAVAPAPNASHAAQQIPTTTE